MYRIAMKAYDGVSTVTTTSPFNTIEGARYARNWCKELMPDRKFEIETNDTDTKDWVRIGQQ